MKKKEMLVIGAGSIGQRHALNLSELGVRVSLYDTNKVSLLEFCKSTGFTPVINLERDLEKSNYCAAIVCTPNHLHIPYAQMVADAGIHLFIEKPLSHSFEGIACLIETVKARKLLAMAGFNLRFEPGLKFIKKNLDLKNVAFAIIEYGSYMPEWRKGVDYRKTYSANKSMGGGIILDDVHELDYACWLFGYPDTFHASYGKYSSFEIDVEDVVDFQMKYPDKLVTIHADYLQRNYTRSCKIGFRDGYGIEWIFGSHVTIYSESGEKTNNYKAHFSVNDMYKDEMKEFIHSIDQGIQPESDLDNAARILTMAISAKMEMT
jgi:predicted dehydrogenase